MSTVFSTEDNLPGVYMDVANDRAASYDTSQFGTTDSVVVIGTAFDGPTGLVVPVYSPEHGRYVFGKSYDSAKRREATLVAGIQDAWDRGCRTIYACRLGGKSLHKDFKLAIDNGFKLRVSSRYPSNNGKQVYVRYDNTLGNETFTLYKPASRATILEKRRGEVTSANAVMKIESALAMDHGMNRDSNLVDAIRIFNEDPANNVLELSIIDENGVDVTDSTEAYALSLGALLPGVYFIGRDDSACAEVTNTKVVIAKGAASTPYSNFDHEFFRVLEYNTDVTQPYPIYFKASERKNFTADMLKVGITMVKPWDFLETAGLVDRAFIPDAVDYEETQLSSFETYKRLGNGYAITAKAVDRGTKADGTKLPPRIIEAPMEDQNRVVPILDGIYGVLEDAEIKYRVVTNASADTKISSKLPRAKDFETTVASAFPVLKDTITLTAKVDESDRTAVRKYDIIFNDVTDAVSDTLDDVFTDEVFPIVPHVDNVADIADVAPGTQVMVMDITTGLGTLHRVNIAGGVDAVHGTSYIGKHFIVGDKIFEGSLVSGTAYEIEYAPVSTPSGLFMSKEYVLGEALDTVFVFQPLATDVLKPLGDLNTMLGDIKDENAALLVVNGQNLPFVDNHVVVNSDAFASMTIGELADAINAHPVLSKLFEAALTDTGAQFRDYMVEDAMTEIGAASAVPGLNTVTAMGEDRTIGYDFNRYIPYRTTDNFARQLAQHCTYTELKTTPTHGFIGCERQTDVSLAAIANRVAKLSKVKFDLYAKNNYGRNLLDRQNLPYAIGRNVSVVFGQHMVTMDGENYRYLSTGASSYAGMVSQLPLDQSSTAQPIAINETTFLLTPSQLSTLTKLGIVTFKKSFTKGIVVTDGTTMAPVDSAFRRLAAWRVMGAVEDLIRAACDPFIGKPNHVTNRNSLNTAIKSRLEKIKGTLIEQYQFQLIVDPKMMKFSYIDINYNIVPIYEIREIRNHISIKDELDTVDVNVG